MGGWEEVIIRAVTLWGTLYLGLTVLGLCHSYWRYRRG